VYISAFPDNKLKETVDDLNERNWEIRHALAARIKNKVRKIPDIRFYADDSFAEADKINSLIDTLEIQPADEEDEANS
ncbi:MAG: ribosome-binding factor A, partial [Bacteroidia bacterium]|nr:ribosome-binding factor A [Bacteroidia bacterium]